MYQRRKNALFRRASELSTLCDCEVAIIMFGPDGELSQFSSCSMEDALRRYSHQCKEVHELHTQDGMAKRMADHTAARAPSAKRRQVAAPESEAPAARGTTRQVVDRDTAEVILAMQDLRPLNGGELTEERPYDCIIDREFEKLVQNRAKRAQQAAENPSGACSAGGASDGEGVSGQRVVSGQPPMTIGQATATFDTLAAALYGAHPTAVDGALGVPTQAAGGTVGPEQVGQRTDNTGMEGKPEKKEECASPNGPRPTVNVRTPAMTLTLPVAGSAEAPGPVGLSGTVFGVSETFKVEPTILEANGRIGPQ